MKLIWSFLTLAILLFIVFCFAECNIRQVSKSGGLAEIEPPSAVFEQFLLASLNGDKKTLNEISFEPDDDWLKACRGGDGIETDGGTKIDSDPPSNLGADAQEKQLYSSGIPENLANFAQYIFVSHVERRRFRIVGEREFENEALLRVKLLDYSKRYSDQTPGYEMAVAFKMVDGKWKLIGVIRTGTFEFVDKNLLYASPRQPCQS